MTERVRVAPLTELPDGRGVKVDALGHRIALFRVGEAVYAIGDRQTWEISCIARREPARESYDNVCHPARLGIANDQGDEE